MSLQSGAVKSIFVVATVALSILLTYLAVSRAPTLYRAEIQFQIAASQVGPRPDLKAERDLILSSSLVAQTLKDSNINSIPEGFRGFNLGGGINVSPEAKGTIEKFRRHLKIIIYPDNSALRLQYSGTDRAETQKILEILFEKYRDWRQPAGPSGFNSNIVKTDQDLAQKRSNFLQSQKDFLNALAHPPADPKSKADLLNRQRELITRIELLKLRYGAKHPAMIEALRRKEAIEQKMAQTNEQGQIKLLKDKMDNDFGVLDNAMKASAIMSEQKNNAQNPFKIMALGDVSVQPEPENLLLKLSLAGFLALLCSYAYLKIRGSISSVYDSREAIAKDFSSTIFAIPQILKKSKDAKGLPSGEVYDALKVLWREIKLKSNDNKPIKLVTITSALPGEGRSELAAGLGYVMARANEKILLLDADLRTPDLQRVVPPGIGRNLVDYLSGQARIDDIISRSDPSGLNAIYGTAVPNTALDLLSSEKMKNFLISVREVYDLVLVIAPPASKGPDARVLADIGDLNLYVVSQGKSLKKGVQADIGSFTKAKPDIVFVN